MQVRVRIAAALLLGFAFNISLSAGHNSSEKVALSPGKTSVPLTDSDSGRLLGMVIDGEGAPLETMLISASGRAGNAIAVCDADGRFEFRALEPGIYLLRAHLSGYTMVHRHVVEIKAGLPTLYSMRLQRTSSTTEITSTVLAAGVASGLGKVASPDWVSRPSEFEESETINPDPKNGLTEPSPHDHTEKAWRLRRAKRSVLKDEAASLQLVNSDNAYNRVDQFGRLHGSPSGDVLNGTAVSGQFQLLTRASIDSPAALWSVDQLPGQVAYFAIGVPVGQPEFGIQGAVTTGDSGSWVIAGSMATETFQNHALELGMSYSKQRPLRDELSLTTANVETSNFYNDRSVASITADGTLALSSMLSVAYGATVAHHGYLENGQLLSPRAQMAVEPTSGTRVRAAISRNMLAPGAEEFLPPSSGVWLPPERTFAPLSVTVPLTPQRTRHIEVAIEQDVGVSSVVGIRRFHQDVTGQMFTLFGVKRRMVGSVGDHYYLTNANGVNSTGWGVSFSHDLPGRLHGVVDYSATRAHWSPWSVAGFSSDTIKESRTGTEQFHDVTTSVETEIPETATHVFILARLNTAFSQVRAGSLAAGLNTRFALRVKQTLPFAPFAGSNWAVLVDVRNLFREQVEGASVYDELLVVNPPKQFVGGLVVGF